LKLFVADRSSLSENTHLIDPLRSSFLKNQSHEIHGEHDELIKYRNI
jgi:hypothetical protein